MKVYRSQGTTALISILDIVFDDDDHSVRNIRDTLLDLKHGESLPQEKVDEIFGDWADLNADSGDPRHFIKPICALLKKEMFRFK